MKSIIEDFDHIASRLTEIEQEKQPELSDDKTAEDCVARFDNVPNYMGVITIDDLYSG